MRAWLLLSLFLSSVGLGGGACAGRAVTAAPPLSEANAALDDRSPDVLFESGVAAEKAGDGARAEQYFGDAMARGYPVETAFSALIGVCLATDRFDTALHYARARLLKEPGDWRLRYLVATLLVSAGQESRALPEIYRLIDERPQRPEPHYLMAVVARDSLGDRRLAIQSFGQYLALAPDGSHGPEARAFLRENRRRASERGRTP